MIKRSFLVFLVLCFSNGMFGQRSVNSGPKTEELSLRFRWIFRKGETTTRYVPLGSIPNAPPIPTGYAAISGRSYLLRSTAIGSEGIVTANAISGSEADFASIRILELERNELFPSGFEWRDCTVLPKTPEDAGQPAPPEWVQYVENYNREMAKYFPDHGTRRVSCSPQMYKGDGADKYLLIVRRTQPPPPSPFTEIKIKLETSGAKGDEKRLCRVTITNAGKKDAVEVNLRSHFTESGVASVRPSQGTCKSSLEGYGRVVCHLGPLAAGRSATIELVAAARAESTRTPGVEVLDEPWLIRGYAREHLADPHWAVNGFEVEELLRNQN